jgi:hypothetical protein
MLKITKHRSLASIKAAAEASDRTHSFEDDYGLYLIEWSEDLDPLMWDLNFYKGFILTIYNSHPLIGRLTGDSIDYGSDIEYLRSRFLSRPVSPVNELMERTGQGKRKRSKGFA